MDKQELVEELENLSARLLSDEVLDHSEIIRRVHTKYGIPLDKSIDHNEVDRYVASISKEVYDLFYKFTEAGLMSPPTDPAETKKYAHLFGRLIAVNHFSNKIAKAYILLSNAGNPDYDYTRDIDPVYMDSTMVLDFEKSTSYQKLLFGLKCKINERNLRKRGEHCMSLLRTEEGYDTKYWVQVESIEEFCNNAVDINTNYNLWSVATKPANNITTAIKRLKESPEGFIEIKKDRHVFSAPNGVLVTDYTNPVTQKLECKFFPYIQGTGGIAPDVIDENRVSCRYFENNFNDYSDTEDWYDIPTPKFQQILDYQGFEEETCRWLYILAIGRMLYEVNELDGWQVIPYFLGVAKSGKSTICSYVCAKIFDHEDVGVLSNNCEKQFGLSAVVDKLAFVAPEIKANFSLEQATFQSLVSGEMTSVSEKFKTARSQYWKAPSVWAGNQLPGYIDNSGSIFRRLVVFYFENSVKHADIRLSEALEEELPNLIQKGCRAYLEAVEKYGRKDLWDGVLPEYFHGVQRNIQAENNPMLGFVHSGLLKFDRPDAVTSKTDLATAYKEYTSLYGVGSARGADRDWSTSVFNRLVKTFGVSIRDKTKYVGVYIRRDTQVDEEDYVIADDPLDS
jgi:hypothetical protein